MKLDFTLKSDDGTLLASWTVPVPAATGGHDIGIHRMLSSQEADGIRVHVHELRIGLTVVPLPSPADAAGDGEADGCEPDAVLEHNDEYGRPW